MNIRIKAFFIHFFGSFLLVGTLLAFNYLVWYPFPLASLQGANEIFFLIAIVDLFIGPLITAFIFDTRKKNLKFDIIVVVVFQFIALGFGAHATFVARPVYAVFYGDRFEITSASEINVNATKNALKQFQTIPLWKFKWVGAVLPEGNITAKNEMLFSSVMGGGLRITPDYYVAYSDIRNTVKTRAKRLDVKLLNDSRAHDLKKYIASLGRPTSEIGLVPLKGREKYGTVVIDLKTGDILSAQAIDPWWY